MHDPTTGAVMPPIYISSTYAQESPGVNKGLDYGRSHNPTRWAFERCVAELESGQAGFAFASGLAAIATTLELLPAGSHVIASDDLYGGTYRLFERVRKITQGLSFTYVDASDPANVEAAVTDNTKMLWVETPSNPLLKLTDLSAVAKVAQKHNLIAVADNTFATPIIQRPIEHGFHLTVHSVTKYINGHSDVIGGMVVASDNRGAWEELIERMAFLQNSVGAILGPFDCFLANRGVKTLHLRVERSSHNAWEIAKWMEQRDDIERVIYPGLPSHPQHELALRQMSDSGGMLTFIVKGGLPRAKQILERLQVFTLAESLGGVESLIEHPAIMTHASIPKDVREKLGITDGLIRLSAGIEDVKDLIADLEQAMQA